MEPINNLKRFCEAYVQATRPGVEKWISRYLKQEEKTKEAILGDWLQSHRALPWYRRWWQRLIFPVTPLETFYEAQQILAINDAQPLKNLLAVIIGIRARLSWFSSLHSEIRKAERFIQQEIKAQYQDNPDKGKTRRAAPANYSSNSTPKEHTLASSSHEPPLRLTAEGLSACERLGIDTSEPITQSIIKKAFRKIALRCHPDKNLGREAEAQNEFQEIGNLYKFLEDFFDNTAPATVSYEFDWGNLASQIAHLKEQMEKSNKKREEGIRELGLYFKEKLREAEQEQRETLQELMGRDAILLQKMEAQQQRHDALMQECVEKENNLRQMLGLQFQELGERKNTLEQEFEQYVQTRQEKLQAHQQQMQTIMALLEKIQMEKTKIESSSSTGIQPEETATREDRQFVSSCP